MTEMIDAEEFFKLLLKRAIMSNVVLSMDGNIDDLEYLHRAHEALTEVLEDVEEMIDAASWDEEKAFACLDCQQSTVTEYYMVHKEVWLKANPADNGMLCIGCLENRLGRTLTADDFTEAPVNEIEGVFTHKSERLQSRLVA